jgi:hypothetical protein
MKERQESVSEASLLMIDYEKPCLQVICAMQHVMRCKKWFKIRIFQMVSHRASDGEVNLNDHL